MGTFGGSRGGDSRLWAPVVVRLRLLLWVVMGLREVVVVEVALGVESVLALALEEVEEEALAFPSPQPPPRLCWQQAYRLPSSPRWPSAPALSAERAGPLGNLSAIQALAKVVALLRERSVPSGSAVRCARR